MPIWSRYTIYGFAGLSAVAGLLWWMMDHRSGTAWAVSVIRDRFPEVPHLSPVGLQNWLEDESRPVPVLVDARSDEEFAVSHLAGALPVNVESVDEDVLKKLDPQSRYVIYCAAGYRACELARRMHGVGISQVSNLEGGIFAWANAGYSVQRDGQDMQAVHSYHPLSREC